MNTLFSNMKIGKKIALALAIPVIGMTIFSGMLVMEKIQTVRNVEVLQSLSTLAVHMSNLVHEQQKERGATAVFLGSKGRKFVSELAVQRQETNKKREVLKQYLETLDRSQLNTTFNDKFDTVLTLLSKMDSIRASVDAQSISAPDAIGYYTGLNGRNLDAIGLSLIHI